MELLRHNFPINLFIMLLLVTSRRRSNSTPVWRPPRKWRHSQLSRLDVLGSALDGVAVLRCELGNELQQGGALVLHRLAVAAEQGLVLGRQHVDAGLQLGEAVADVMHQQPDNVVWEGEGDKPFSKTCS